MPDRIDEFESVFRSADKPAFHFDPPKIEKLLLSMTVVCFVLSSYLFLPTIESLKNE